MLSVFHFQTFNYVYILQLMDLNVFLHKII